MIVLLSLDVNDVDHRWIRSGRGVLHESAMRVCSMALMHEMLYESSDLSEIRIIKKTKKVC